MTNNQISYQRLLEDQRHNLVSEGEINRHNQSTERVANMEFIERARSNRAQEGHNRNVLLENSRHNVAQETEANRANKAREEETHRANVATEDWRSLTAAETARSNLAHEGETSRHNLAQENLGWEQMYWTTAETKRHNKEVEAETNRANLANETLKQDQIDQDYTKWFNDYGVRADQAEADRLYKAGQLLTNVANIIAGVVKTTR